MSTWSFTDQRSRLFIDLVQNHSDSIFLNFFSSVTADFNIFSTLRWAIQNQWSSGYISNFLSFLKQTVKKKKKNILLHATYHQYPYIYSKHLVKTTRYTERRFDIIYTVVKYVTSWNEGTFVRTAPVKEVGVLWNNSKSLGKGLSYVCSLLFFDHQILFPEPVAEM